MARDATPQDAKDTQRNFVDLTQHETKYNTSAAAREDPYNAGLPSTGMCASAQYVAPIANPCDGDSANFAPECRLHTQMPRFSGGASCPTRGNENPFPYKRSDAAVAADKTASAKDRIDRNFGLAKPSCGRTSLNAHC